MCHMVYGQPKQQQQQVGWCGVDFFLVLVAIDMCAVVVNRGVLVVSVVAGSLRAIIVLNLDAL